MNVFEYISFPLNRKEQGWFPKAKLKLKYCSQCVSHCGYFSDNNYWLPCWDLLLLPPHLTCRVWHSLLVYFLHNSENNVQAYLFLGIFNKGCLREVTNSQDISIYFWHFWPWTTWMYICGWPLTTALYILPNFIRSRGWCLTP